MTNSLFNLYIGLQVDSNGLIELGRLFFLPYACSVLFAFCEGCDYEDKMCTQFAALGDDFTVYFERLNGCCSHEKQIITGATIQVVNNSTKMDVPFNSTTFWVSCYIVKSRPQTLSALSKKKKKSTFLPVFFFFCECREGLKPRLYI